jgi:hypothetical protein
VQNFNYGASFAFDVTFSGPAVGHPDPSGTGSTFSLTLWSGPIMDSAGPGPTGQPEFPMDSSGAALHIDINPTDGSTFATADPHVTAQQVATSVPEPSALMLVLIGATGMAAFARLRRSKATSLHKQPTSAGCPPHWRA